MPSLPFPPPVRPWQVIHVERIKEREDDIILHCRSSHDYGGVLPGVTLGVHIHRCISLPSYNGNSPAESRIRIRQ